MARLKCPECDSTLNPAKPIPPGKKVKCPRCESVFTVPAPDEDDDEQEEPVRKKPPAQKAAANIKKGTPAKPAGKPEPKPEPKKPSFSDDEEDTGATYGIKATEEDEEDEDKKPKIEYAPDLSVKDPRGKATAKLIVPSNWIIVHGAELFFGGILVFAIGLWPFVFGKYLLDTKAYVRKAKIEAKEKEQEKLRQQSGGGGGGGGGEKKKEEEEYVEDIEPDELKKQFPKYYDKWIDDCDEKQEELIWTMVGGVLAGCYGVFVCYGGVKMQNLESYTWALTASIMVVVAGLGLGGFGFYKFVEEVEPPDVQSMAGLKYAFILLSGIFFGGWSISLLKDEKMKEAFAFKPE